ncbi:heparan-alpha-glucosaminide N-acetyltransferase domain-containing protein [Methanosarcina horonobensis]|uniref:heparan-alpha-glucosaminide N-acetyltransferase domain-containing protein n=1 Tax=Methanosarcina horonobensis TaxID=418008 RepID=UPI000AA680A3
MSQNIFNSNNKSSLRIPSVDILRGLALLLMIEAHIPISVEWASKWSNILLRLFFDYFRVELRLIFII